MPVLKNFPSYMETLPIRADVNLARRAMIKTFHQLESEGYKVCSDQWARKVWKRRIIPRFLRIWEELTEEFKLGPLPREYMGFNDDLLYDLWEDYRKASEAKSEKLRVECGFDFVVDA